MRHQNQFVLRWRDEKNPGKMSIQDDFEKAARSVATDCHQGWEMPKSNQGADSEQFS